MAEEKSIFKCKDCNQKFCTEHYDKHQSDQHEFDAEFEGNCVVCEQMGKHGRKQ